MDRVKVDILLLVVMIVTEADDVGLRAPRLRDRLLKQGWIDEVVGIDER